MPQSRHWFHSAMALFRISRFSSRFFSTESKAFRVPECNQFDLIVLGSGPAGQKAAINAAKLKKRVAMVDLPNMMGGVCVHTGTVLLIRNLNLIF